MPTASCNPVRIAHGHCTLYVRSIANGRQETNASARIVDLHVQRDHLSEPVDVPPLPKVLHLQRTSDVGAEAYIYMLASCNQCGSGWRFGELHHSHPVVLHLALPEPGKHMYRI